ncbi:C39 family peptidase [Pseudomonas sp. MWU12-2345]|uniref:C39 family peptidase n=1 Tax=Pseudomonas sp. MWU12-2345 TaxID=2928689 RepID=UPI00200E30CB|nr:C39 family peptidase [Pseudomonas sp. MWU12-2345]
MPLLDVEPMKQQHRNSCWATCVRMVLWFNQLYVTSDDALANKLGVDADRCTDVKDIMELCNIYEMGESDVRADFNDLLNALNSGNPIIQCVSEVRPNKGKASTGGHYILIIGCTDQQTSSGTTPPSITVIDPADGKIHSGIPYVGGAIAIPGYAKTLFYTAAYYSMKGAPFKTVGK